MGAMPVVNLTKLHFGEEPVISGERGSGTVFFEGCSLGCIFCQNHEISRGYTNKGKEVTVEELSEMFLSLQKMGAHNINLVTFMHFAPSVREALVIAKQNGLTIPVAANISGYENPETLKSLEGLIDIYMPDFKFWDKKLSLELAHASNYSDCAKLAIAEMFSQVGEAVIADDGLMKKGLIVRHLMLPGKLFDSKKIIDYLTDTYGDKIYISLMNQYTPMPGAQGYLSNKLKIEHYESMCEYLMVKEQNNAFVQDSDASGTDLIPDFLK